MAAAAETMGDGFLATFDGPARAIRCARTLQEEVARLGLEVRAGIHTGEVELIGDGVGGMAVNIGARIGALAGPDEVLVSSTVRELVVGSGLEFADRGIQTLKGPRRMAVVCSFERELSQKILLCDSSVSDNELHLPSSWRRWREKLGPTSIWTI